jgi:hypothetical protein
MKLEINSIPSKSKNVTEKDREIINRALVSYQIVLGQYEKYTNDMKRKDLEKLARQNETNTLDALNPFNVDLAEEKTYEPTLEDTKTFVYSSWAEAIANVKTPYICDGQKRKGIKRQAFRDVQNGKYLTNKVRDVMNDFIARLLFGNTGKTENEK